MSLVNNSLKHTVQDSIFLQFSNTIIDILHSPYILINIVILDIMSSFSKHTERLAKLFYNVAFFGPTDI